MKKLLCLLTVTWVFGALAQTPEVFRPIKEEFPPTCLLEEVEHGPIFPGCEAFDSDNDELFACFMQNLTAFVGREFHFPDEARNIGIEGRFYVWFILNEEGIVDHVEILRSLDPHLDKEAIRVVKMLPQMVRPAYNNGKPARIGITLPIHAQLNTLPTAANAQP